MCTKPLERVRCERGSRRLVSHNEPWAPGIPGRRSFVTSSDTTVPTPPGIHTIASTFNSRFAAAAGTVRDRGNTGAERPSVVR